MSEKPNLFQKIKFIWKALTQFKNVVSEYESATKEKAPLYLHRRFIHSVILLLAIIVGYLSGVNIDELTINNITDNIMNIATSIVSLWSIIGIIIGYINRSKAK